MEASAGAAAGLPLWIERERFFEEDFDGGAAVEQLLRYVRSAPSPPPLHPPPPRAPLRTSGPYPGAALPWPSGGQ